MPELVQIRETIIWEFSGGYPDVPIIDGIDMGELTQGTEPFFVTLPIGKAGVVSGNSTYYGADFQRELVQQVLSKRPTGIMGHIPDHERSSSFPLPAAHWIGAIQHEGMTWGKAFIPPGPVREFVRRLKATGGKLATSIYGLANREWSEELSAWTLSEFELESIDLAPPERAGIRDLAVVPRITAEMQQPVAEDGASESDPEPISESEESVDRLQIIQELTAADARLLPNDVVNAIRAEDLQQVAELRQVLNVGEDADLVQTVRELAETVREQQAAAVASRVAELTRERIKADDEDGSISAMIRELVMAERPADVASVDQAFETVLARPHVKAVLQMAVLQEMGPAQRNPVGTRQAEESGPQQYFDIPTRD